MYTNLVSQYEDRYPDLFAYYIHQRNIIFGKYARHEQM